MRVDGTCRFRACSSGEQYRLLQLPSPCAFLGMVKGPYMKVLEFAQIGWRAHNLKMLSFPRVILWQAAAIVCGIALAVALSRFFPVVSFIAAFQERVMSWGAWAGICSSLFFAFFSSLPLPGGILFVGGFFFFVLWWVFLFVLAGNIVPTAISFALSLFVARRCFRQNLAANPTLKALGPA